MSPASAASDPPRPARRPKRTVAVAASVVLHLGLVAALLLARPERAGPPGREVAPEPVAWVRTEPAPAPAPAPPAEAARASASVRATPAAVSVTPTPPPRPTPPRAVSPREALPSGGAPAIGDAELAGAAGVGPDGGGAGGGSGSGGGACDMPRRLQAALRRDRLVQAAAAARGARPLLVWNGDWAPSDGEDGRGLAAVREALIWEIGFAPAECRRQPVSGLVLLSLGDGPGAPRLVMGARAWRWSDLVLAH